MPMQSNKEAKRAAYYRLQASACAAAAITAVLPDTKQAYLDLAQGWLCLAPKAETRLNDQLGIPVYRETEPASDVSSESSHALVGGAAERGLASVHSTGRNGFADDPNGFAGIRAK